MLLSIFNRALLQGIMASAVVLAGATACSRSDRDDTAGDNSAAVLPDTTGVATDTGTTTGAISDTASATAPSNAPRARTAPAGSDSVQSGNKEEEAAAGYREMDRDTATTPSEPDSARVNADTSETSLNTGDSASVETAGAAPVTDTTPAAVAIDERAVAVDSANAADTSAAELAVTSDTAAAGYAKMARDTATGTPEQADTALQAEADVVEADTAVIHARVDTTAEVPTEVAIETSPDTVTVVGDSSSVDKPGPRAKEDTISIKADSLAQHHDADRVRPPEDSTEILGNVTGDETADEADVSQDEQETVAASEAPGEKPTTDEVGAAAIGGNVTGVDAVSLLTRQGEQCIVVDPESNERVRWDMSSTPATLNPCGLGSMNLSKIWTRTE
jgi:hypothetical protein